MADENRTESGRSANRGLYRAILVISLMLFAVATFLSIFTLFAMFDSASSEKYLWMPCSEEAFLVGTLLSAAFFLVILLIQTKERLAALWALFIGGVMLRIVVAWIIAGSLSPFSDYLQVWDIAHGVADDQILLYKSFFPEWSNWAALLKLLVDIFSVDYDFLIWCECAIGCLIALEIIWLSHTIFKQWPIAVMAGSIYAFLPSQVLFSMICKPDSLSLLFILAGMTLCVRLLDMPKLVKPKLVLTAVAAGLSMAIGTSFKPLAIIAVIAFAICWILTPRSNGSLIESFMMKVIPIAIVGLFVVAMPGITRPLSSEILDADVSSSATMSYLCIGLNTEGEGQIHLGSKARFYNQQRMNGASEQEAVSSTIAMLQDDWKENWENLPSLFANKIRWAWQDDMMPALFLKNALGDSANSMVGVLAAGEAASQIAYILLMAFAAGGILVLLREKKKINYSLLFILLYILGFALLLLLSEAQSRYKSNILPLVVIVSALGFRSFVSFMRSMVPSSRVSASVNTSIPDEGHKGNDARVEGEIAEEGHSCTLAARTEGGSSNARALCYYCLTGRSGVPARSR